MDAEVYEIDLSPVFAWIKKSLKYLLGITTLLIIIGLIYIYTRPPIVHTISYIRSSSLPTTQISTANTQLSNRYIVHPKVAAEYIEANQKKICGNQCKIRVTLIQRNDYPIRLEIIGENANLLVEKHNKVLNLLNQLPAVSYYQNKYTEEYKQLLASKQQLLVKYKKNPKLYADMIPALQNEIQMYEQALAGLKNLNFWFVINPQVEEK